MPRLLLSALLVVVTMGIALWLEPFDSDAAFAVHDGIWYSVQAERYGTGSISPHHPMFHVLVLGVLPGVRAILRAMPASWDAPVDHPGHVASRFIAGCGGIWLLLQLMALAGRRRWLVGAGFALVLFCTRGFLIEMSCGENVLPAAAAGLFALTLAARPGTRLLAVGAALTFAGLMRQDNVFIAPGVAWAVAARLPKGERLISVLKLAFGVLVATLLGYAIAWAVSHAANEGPLAWMLRFGLEGPWTGPPALELGRFPVYCFSIALMMTGRIAPPDEDEPLLGLAYVAVILLPVIFLRGTAPDRRLAIPVAIVLVGRACFHTWYEADNFEWLVLPVAMVMAFGISWCRGEPATDWRSRIVGACLLVGLAVFLLAVHGKWTWKLRQRRFMASVQNAVDVDRGRWRFISDGSRTGVAFLLAGIPQHKEGTPFAGTYTDLGARTGTDLDFLERLKGEIARNPVPTVVVKDRFVGEGMPYAMWSEDHWFMDEHDFAFPGLELIRFEGKAYAARITPLGAAAESRR